MSMLEPFILLNSIFPTNFMGLCHFTRSHSIGPSNGCMFFFFFLNGCMFVSYWLLSDEVKKRKMWWSNEWEIDKSETQKWLFTTFASQRVLKLVGQSRTLVHFECLQNKPYIIWCMYRTWRTCTFVSSYFGSSCHFNCKRISFCGPTP